MSQIIKIPHEDFVNKARNGDDASFARLYREFSGFVFAILRRHMGASPYVEDLLQLIFIKVYRELPEYREDKSFRSWLRQACYFVMYDHFKASKRHKYVPVDETVSNDKLTGFDSVSEKADENPSQKLLQSQIKKQTHIILDKLKPPKRMALVMHDFEGYTVSEIADVLSLSKFTVRTRLVRARREFAAIGAMDNKLMELLVL